MFRKTIIVNLWGGPGVGKSTTATGVFSDLKQQGVIAEYVPEFAKSLTWAQDLPALDNQFYVSGYQLEMLREVLGQVQVVVTDSPVMLGSIYQDSEVFSEALEETYSALTKGFPDIDILLTRRKGFVQEGRNQTEQEAKDICKKIAASRYFTMEYPGGTKDTIKKISKLIQDNL